MAKKEKNSKAATPQKAPASGVTKRIWQRPYFFDLVVFAFAFLLFANSIPNGYNLDDELVTINHRLTSKGASAIGEIFSSPYYQDESGYSYEYRPVVLVSFAIEHQFFGDDPHVSHFFNVLLYALTCVVLLRVLRLLFKGYSPMIAFGVTLLYIAHPAHTEVVCSIKNRDEILGLLFSLLSMLALLYAVQKRRMWLLGAVPALFVVSLLSKLTFMSFALIIPLSLLFYENISLPILLYVVSSLSISLVSAVHIGDIPTKVFIVMASVMGILIIYSIRHFSIVQRRISLWGSAVADTSRYAISESNINFDNLFTGFSVPSSFFTLTYTSATAFVLGLYFGGVFSHVLFFQIAAALCVIVLLNLKNESLKWHGTCCLYIIMAFNSYYYGFLVHAWYLNFFLLPLMFTLIYGRRNLIIPTILTLAFIIGASLTLPLGDKIGINPLIIFLLLFIQRYRYGWVALVVGLLLKVVLAVTVDLPDIHTDPWAYTMDKLDYITLFVLGISIRFKAQAANISKLFLMLAFLFSVLLHPHQKVDDKIVKDTLQTVGNLNPRLVEKNSNRPVLLIENCIEFGKTPQPIVLGTSLEILLHYLHNVVLPYPLSFYYGYRYIDQMSIADPIPLASLILHIVLLAVAIYTLRRNKFVSFGILLYLISILPFSNYMVSIPGMIADRFLLIPSLGWTILLVAALFTLGRTSLQRDIDWKATTQHTRIGFGAILIFYSSLTFSRNFLWKDYITLFEHDVRYVDNSAQAHNLLAINLMKRSYDPDITPADRPLMYKKAAGHFRKSIEIYPLFFNAIYDLGRTYRALGEGDSAVKYFSKALTIDSTFTPAAQAIMDIYLEHNNSNAAYPYFSMIRSQYPTDYGVYEKFGYALFMQKNYPAAISVMKSAVANIPANPLPYVSLAKLYHALNDGDSTRYWLHEALRVDPNNIEARQYLNATGKP